MTPLLTRYERVSKNKTLNGEFCHEVFRGEIWTVTN
jgi:hypothetical protein